MNEWSFSHKEDSRRRKYLKGGPEEIFPVMFSNL